MSEERAMHDPERNPIAERQEREAYLLLFHVFNVTAGDPAVELAPDRLARDLAFEWPQVVLLVDHLVMCGHVRCRVEGGVCITPDGVDYVGTAGRRRSVRSKRGQPTALAKWGGVVGEPT
jgi:hypothetical protein